MSKVVRRRLAGCSSWRWSDGCRRARAGRRCRASWGSSGRSCTGGAIRFVMAGRKHFAPDPGAPTGGEGSDGAGTRAGGTGARYH